VIAVTFHECPVLKIRANIEAKNFSVEAHGTGLGLVIVKKMLTMMKLTNKKA
jgi:hypothetical protein